MDVINHSGADSIIHEGTCPRLLQMAGQRGTVSRKKIKEEIDLTVQTSRKRSPKRLNNCTCM